MPKAYRSALDLNLLSEADFMQQVNLRLQLKLYKALNHENNNAQLSDQNVPYRYFIGFGNNYN